MDAVTTGVMMWRCQRIAVDKQNPLSLVLPSGWLLTYFRGTFSTQKPLSNNQPDFSPRYILEQDTDTYDYEILKLNQQHQNIIAAGTVLVIIYILGVTLIQKSLLNF